MQKKVFLQRNSRKTAERPPYIKLALVGALVLVVLVVLTPFLMRKSMKETAQKPEPSKGVLVKEIPRTGSLGQESEQREVQLPGGNKTDSESRSASVRDDPVSPSGEKEKGTSDAPSQKPAKPGAGTGVEQNSTDYELASQANRSPIGKTPEMPQFSPIGGKENPDAAAPIAGKKPESESASKEAGTKVAKVTPATPSPAAPSPAAKAKEQKQPSSTKGLFAVQVGAFKEKEHAEQMRSDLEKKGYKVEIKPQTHSKLGQLYVVRLSPVSDMGKAETMMMQIQHESHVKPYLIKLPSGE
jgi:cell division septation protein DedD